MTVKPGVLKNNPTPRRDTQHLKNCCGDRRGVIYGHRDVWGSTLPVLTQV